MKQIKFILVSALIIIGASCSKSKVPDNVIHSSFTSQQDFHWQYDSALKKNIPVYDTVYVLLPTAAQARYYSSRQEAWNPQQIIGWLCIGIGIIAFVLLIIKPVSNPVPAFAASIGVAILGIILYLTGYDTAKYNNEKEILKTKYDSLMSADGTTQAYWDKMEADGLILGGKNK